MRVLTLLFLFIPSLLAAPSAPTDPAHPGFPTRGLRVKTIAVDFIRKGSVLFLPDISEGEVLPVVVFAHGQALKLKHYELFLKTLASKGIAVLYPQYDKGFFDTDWRRMGKDYDEIVEYVLRNNPQLNKESVLFSGHSKGGYIGLMALSHHSKKSYDWFPKASLFLSPAGFEKGSLSLIPREHSVTLVWPQRDRVIKKELIDEIYDEFTVANKQRILVQGYDDLKAGHFFILSEKSLFGGNKGVGPFHWYGAIPWVWGALIDPYYLYEEGALNSGDPQVPHIRE